MMRALAFFLCLALLPVSGLADESTPLLYTRTHIKILRKSMNEAPTMPWQQKQDYGLVLDVESRDGATLYNQNGWFNLSPPKDKSGVLLVFSAPTLAPVTHSAQYAPLDVLMIDQEGTVVQIAPNLKLSELTDDVYPKSPVLALLFLKGGTCDALSIRPGDEVEYKIFHKPPVVLTAPPASAPAMPAKPAPESEPATSP